MVGRDWNVRASERKQLKRLTTGRINADWWLIHQYSNTSFDGAAATKPWLRSEFKVLDLDSSNVAVALGDDTDTNVKHIMISDDATKIVFLSRVACSALSVIEAYARGQRIKINRDAAYRSVFNLALDFVEAGVVGDPLPHFDTSLGVLEDVEDCQAENTYKDVLVGTKDGHTQQYFKAMYFAARKYKDIFPKQDSALFFQDRTKEIRNAWLMFMTAKFTMVYYDEEDFVPHGQTIADLVPKALVRGGLANLTAFGDIDVTPNLDTIWDMIMKRIKPTHCPSTSGDGMEHYTEFQTDLMDDTWVNNDTFNNLMFIMKQKCWVCSSSLVNGRKYYGTGTYDKKKFTISVIRGKPAASGTGSTHGITDILIGYELKIHLNDIRARMKYDIKNVFELAMTNQLHYNFKDIRPMIGDMFEEYTIFKTLQGYCNPEAYIGARVVLNNFTQFNTTNKYKKDTYIANGIDTSLLDSSTPKKFTLQVNQLQNLCWLLSSADLDDYIDHSLVFGGGWTKEEIMAVIFFQFKYQVTSSANWQDNRFNVFGWSVFSVCDALNIETDPVAFVTSNIEEKRIDYYLSRTNYPDFVKYMYSAYLTHGEIDYARKISEARPYGDKEPTYLDLGTWEDCYQIMIDSIGLNAGDKDAWRKSDLEEDAKELANLPKNKKKKKNKNKKNNSNADALAPPSPLEVPKGADMEEEGQ